MLLPAGFDFDLQSWDVGKFMDTTSLSYIMRLFGGFPESVFVREEMRQVSRVISRSLLQKWVIIGSPGVGKSVLLVLQCLYLATVHKQPVFLARQLKGDTATKKQTGMVALCIRPDGRVTGYDSPRNVGQLDDIFTKFKVECEAEGQEVTLALDGWSQQELQTGNFLQPFGNFDLLATSAQYKLKSQDARELVVLPAWREPDIRLVGQARNITESDIKDRYYHSGGSLGDFLKELKQTENRLNVVLSNLKESTHTALLSGYGGSQNEFVDCIRRVYVNDITNEDSYYSSKLWNFVVDSSYALARLVSDAPLKVFENSLIVAKANGGAFYGWAFEAYIHRIFTSKPQEYLIEMWPYLNYSSIPESRSIPSDIPVSKVGSSFKLFCSYLRTVGSKLLYWIPDITTFPEIDSILIDPLSKIVSYYQITTASEHSLNFNNLKKIHLIVKESLGENADGWTFEYVAICDSEKIAKRLKLKINGTSFADLHAVKVSCIRKEER